MRKLKSLFQMVFSFGNATSVASKQRKSGAIRTICVSFTLYRLFAPQGQATRAEGVAECASTLDPDALPQAPTLRSLSKSGFALSPGRRFLPLIHRGLGHN